MISEHLLELKLLSQTLFSLSHSGTAILKCFDTRLLLKKKKEMLLGILLRFSFLQLLQCPLVTRYPAY